MGQRSFNGDAGANSVCAHSMPRLSENRVTSGSVRRQQDEYQRVWGRTGEVVRRAGHPGFTTLGCVSYISWGAGYRFALS